VKVCDYFFTFLSTFFVRPKKVDRKKGRRNRNPAGSARASAGTCGLVLLWHHSGEKRTRPQILIGLPTRQQPAVPRCPAHGSTKVRWHCEIVAARAVADQAGSAISFAFTQSRTDAKRNRMSRSVHYPSLRVTISQRLSLVTFFGHKESNNKESGHIRTGHKESNNKVDTQALTKKTSDSTLMGSEVKKEF
jgi:hypothetical protein